MPATTGVFSAFGGFGGGGGGGPPSSGGRGGSGRRGRGRGGGRAHGDVTMSDGGGGGSGNRGRGRGGSRGRGGRGGNHSSGFGQSGGQALNPNAPIFQSQASTPPAHTFGQSPPQSTSPWPTPQQAFASQQPLGAAAFGNPGAAAGAAAFGAARASSPPQQTPQFGQQRTSKKRGSQGFQSGSPPGVSGAAAFGNPQGFNTGAASGVKGGQRSHPASGFGAAPQFNRQAQQGGLASAGAFGRGQVAGATAFGGSARRQPHPGSGVAGAAAFGGGRQGAVGAAAFVSSASPHQQQPGSALAGAAGFGGGKPFSQPGAAAFGAGIQGALGSGGGQPKKQAGAAGFGAGSAQPGPVAGTGFATSSFADAAMKGKRGGRGRGASGGRGAATSPIQTPAASAFGASAFGAGKKGGRGGGEPSAFATNQRAAAIFGAGADNQGGRGKKKRGHAEEQHQGGSLASRLGKRAPPHLDMQPTPKERGKGRGRGLDEAAAKSPASPFDRLKSGLKQFTSPTGSKASAFSRLGGALFGKKETSAAQPEDDEEEYQDQGDGYGDDGEDGYGDDGEDGYGDDGGDGYGDDGGDGYGDDGGDGYDNDGGDDGYEQEPVPAPAPAKKSRARVADVTPVKPAPKAQPRAPTPPRDTGGNTRADRFATGGSIEMNQTNWDEARRITQTDLSKAVDMVGTCETMCPPREMHERGVELVRAVDYFESDPAVAAQYMTGPEKGKWPADESRMVKKYQRPTACQAAPQLDDLRTTATLLRTTDYLCSEILNREDMPFMRVYDFVRDRFRSIQQDLTYQNIRDVAAVEITEKIARFYIFAWHRLCNAGEEGWSQKLNSEQLTKCLVTLQHIYADLYADGITCEYEAEFQSYYILVHMHDPKEVATALSKLRPVLLDSNEITNAVKAYHALRERNGEGYFRVMKECSYLAACLMNVEANRARIDMVKQLHHCVAFLPMQKVFERLCFDSEEQCAEFLLQFGITYQRDAVFPSRPQKKNIDEPDEIPPPKQSQVLVQSKAENQPPSFVVSDTFAYDRLGVRVSPPVKREKPAPAVKLKRVEPPVAEVKPTPKPTPAAAPVENTEDQDVAEREEREKVRKKRELELREKLFKTAEDRKAKLEQQKVEREIKEKADRVKEQLAEKKKELEIAAKKQKEAKDRQVKLQREKMEKEKALEKQRQAEKARKEKEARDVEARRLRALQLERQRRVAEKQRFTITWFRFSVWRKKVSEVVHQRMLAEAKRLKRVWKERMAITLFRFYQWCSSVRQIQMDRAMKNHARECLEAASFSTLNSLDKMRLLSLGVGGDQEGADDVEVSKAWEAKALLRELEQWMTDREAKRKEALADIETPLCLSDAFLGHLESLNPTELNFYFKVAVSLPDEEEDAESSSSYDVVRWIQSKLSPPSDEDTTSLLAHFEHDSDILTAYWRLWPQRPDEVKSLRRLYFAVRRFRESSPSKISCSQGGIFVMRHAWATLPDDEKFREAERFSKFCTALHDPDNGCNPFVVLLHQEHTGYRVDTGPEDDADGESPSGVQLEVDEGATVLEDVENTFMEDSGDDDGTADAETMFDMDGEDEFDEDGDVMFDGSNPWGDSAGGVGGGGGMFGDDVNPFADFGGGTDEDAPPQMTLEESVWQDIEDNLIGPVLGQSEGHALIIPLFRREENSGFYSSKSLGEAFETLALVSAAQPKFTSITVRQLVEGGVKWNLLAGPTSKQDREHFVRCAADDSFIPAPPPSITTFIRNVNQAVKSATKALLRVEDMVSATTEGMVRCWLPAEFRPNKDESPSQMGQNPLSGVISQLSKVTIPDLPAFDGGMPGDESRDDRDSSYARILSYLLNYFLALEGKSERLGPEAPVYVPQEYFTIGKQLQESFTCRDPWRTAFLCVFDNWLWKLNERVGTCTIPSTELFPITKKDVNLIHVLNAKRDHRDTRIMFPSQYRPKFASRKRRFTASTEVDYESQRVTKAKTEVALDDVQSYQTMEEIETETETDIEPENVRGLRQGIQSELSSMSRLDALLEKAMSGAAPGPTVAGHQLAGPLRLDIPVSSKTESLEIAHCIHSPAEAKQLSFAWDIKNAPPLEQAYPNVTRGPNRVGTVLDAFHEEGEKGQTFEDYLRSVV